MDILVIGTRHAEFSSWISKTLNHIKVKKKPQLIAEASLSKPKKKGSIYDNNDNNVTPHFQIKLSKNTASRKRT